MEEQANEVDVVILLSSASEHISIHGSRNGVLRCHDTLHNPEDSAEIRAGLDMLDALLLAFVTAGVDVEACEEGIEQVVINFYAEHGE